MIAEKIARVSISLALRLGYTARAVGRGRRSAHIPGLLRRQDSHSSTFLPPLPAKELRSSHAGAQLSLHFGYATLRSTDFVVHFSWWVLKSA